ncbi:flavodoxin family protein [Brucepastera parasyntrophica]|uniref:flavodoxin family protein n=1 Tax=Brucepastera parasyntrophica TaxID=2880008 RepID=UPI00210BF6C2|nr:flavodoxin family protein [Brucepastera parasyntrophica]ULQ59159.1 flavodoxin family protein [Brucepastera parasyntrophica]
MKVLMINGSPREKGCTFTALSEIADALNRQDIETEIIHIGAKPVRGCLGCGSCNKTGRCIMEDDVNAIMERLPEFDGFIFGSPVHFAALSGALTSFMDRLFYAGRHLLVLKPAAGIVSCRRGGATAAFDQINKYFTISNMPVVSSQYWNMVHGNSPEEVKQDLEGLQIMRTLGNNMAWLLKSIEAGKAAGVRPPEPEPPARTNFIR